MRVGYHSITWGGVVGDATGVTSVKDLYYRANGSMAQAFTDIAAAGYAGTEMFDGNLVTYADRPDELARLLPRTRIGFCPDTAHLAAGGGDPAALIRRYPDRIRHVHLKDLRSDPFGWLPLGQGVLDFADIMRAVRETGYDSWLIVELDDYDGDPREAAEISKTYLDGLLKDLSA